MSLTVLVALVVIGISLVVAAVHFTGGGKLASIDDADDARTIFARDFPDEEPADIMLTADRCSAFLVLPGARIGMVQSFGDGFFTRIASAKDVAAINLRERRSVSIRFRDFTWTGGNFLFGEEGPAGRIAAALNPNQPGHKA